MAESEIAESYLNTKEIAPEELKAKELTKKSQILLNIAHAHVSER